MIGHRCSSCIWFDCVHDSLRDIKLMPGKFSIGYCRKHFPGSIGFEGKHWGIWPLVDIKDFCGEFRKQE